MDDAADEVNGGHVACGGHAGVALPRPASAGYKPQRQVMCLNVPIVCVWDRRMMAHVHVYIHTAPCGLWRPRRTCPAFRVQGLGSRACTGM